ncbi:hypothetical protein D3C81_1779800 [compost metagenome]
MLREIQGIGFINSHSFAPVLGINTERVAGFGWRLFNLTANSRDVGHLLRLARKIDTHEVGL